MNQALTSERALPCQPSKQLAPGWATHLAELRDEGWDGHQALLRCVASDVGDGCVGHGRTLLAGHDTRSNGLGHWHAQQEPARLAGAVGAD